MEFREVWELYHQIGLPNIKNVVQFALYLNYVVALYLNCAVFALYLNCMVLFYNLDVVLVEKIYVYGLNVLSACFQNYA